MKHIGLTGGLGSGKSTALNMFYDLGANILNADDIAKSLLQVNPALIADIKNAFGSDCYVDGKLQTAVLAERAFSSTENQKRLNALTHPLLKQHLEKYLKATQAIPGVLIVEAAVLMEAEYETLFDTIILVTTDENIRLQRAIARQILDENSIKKRMFLQMPEAQKRRGADYIIENNGTKDELQTACKACWKKITAS